MRRSLATTLALVIAAGSFPGCSTEALPSAASASTAPAAPKAATAKPGTKSPRSVGNDL